MEANRIDKVVRQLSKELPPLFSRTEVPKLDSRRNRLSFSLQLEFRRKRPTLYHDRKKRLLCA